MSAYSARWNLPTSPAEVRQGRDIAQKALLDWGADPDIVDELVLVVSELHANAVRHGCPPIALLLSVDGGCVDGAVIDHGPHEPFEPPREASLTAERGRGLHIVDALVNKWGVTPATDAGTGARVWFTRCW